MFSFRGIVDFFDEKIYSLLGAIDWLPLIINKIKTSSRHASENFVKKIGLTKSVSLGKRYLNFRYNVKYIKLAIIPHYYISAFWEQDGFVPQNQQSKN